MSVAAVLPPFSLNAGVVKTMQDYAARLAHALNVKGLLNVQFAIKDNFVYRH
jgi:carbamoyl-phosphate synthase large subunit